MASGVSRGASARLGKLDDLFAMNGGVNPLDQVPTLIERRADPGPSVEVPIDGLRPFKNSPFRPYTGERLEDMVESVRANGVLVPIIVRKVEGAHEILAGHNRVQAARLAGLTRAPAVVLERVADEDAWVYVIETNLMQRSFADMLHSERAAVIAAHHSKMFSQRKRDDILYTLRSLENQLGGGVEALSGRADHVDQRPGVRDLVAAEYGLSSTTVARYLRIHVLPQAIKARMDDGEIAFLAGVALSFLRRDELRVVDRFLGEGHAVDIKKADVLRRYSAKDRLGEETVRRILAGEIGRKPKPNRTPVVKVRKELYARYFKPGQSARDVQEIVEMALAMYFSV